MYIVKSAVLLANGNIELEYMWNARVFQPLGEPVEHGFIDDSGCWRNRREAMIIARDAGQIISDEEELYAEDLWPKPVLLED